MTNKKILALSLLCATVASTCVLSSTAMAQPARGGLFKTFDTNQDKNLDKEELTKLINHENQKINEKRKLLVDFTVADANKDGFVTLDELAVVCPTPKLQPHKSQMSNNEKRPNKKHPPLPKKGQHALYMLDKHDQNGDLKLDSTEYANLIKTELAYLDKRSQVFNNLSNADVNRDGLVSFDEFKTYMHDNFKAPKKHKRNKD